MALEDSGSNCINNKDLEKMGIVQNTSEKMGIVQNTSVYRKLLEYIEPMCIEAHLEAHV